MSHILIAEDHASISSFVESGLQSAGYGTTVVTDGSTALLMAKTGAFDLVILDIGLPVMDGFEVLKQLREAGAAVPVIILTARDSVIDTVAGLEGGASDYVTKPFQFAELLARVRLRLREHSPQPAAPAHVLEGGGMVLDLRSRRVKVGEEQIDLTAREFSLLEVFMLHPEQVLSREQLLGHVWGVDFDPGSNVVEVCVRTVRRKIGSERIETVRGMGYRLRALTG
ncbi:response regulator transcription factor [Granulicoccus sp. GXG6511]|uniref:response regulator transcription factor n=1 Tax=Granulicoccus sp. GXG6511 TaxID=3381351 RepID=UPI003D7E9B46